MYNTVQRLPTLAAHTHVSSSHLPAAPSSPQLLLSKALLRRSQARRRSFSLSLRCCHLTLPNPAML